ncbi:hypothetical protein DRW07_05275 [Alteromonas sediminis]|uniref:Uncharacterized protein n=1 Tax=Alteromonas sediminis TaxID=2259342 RepID=A0A3N5Y2R6_9ALTE|nr:hypothetical protein [Alteromonas sediminis]RPJ66956.1 hypothetical protein DRW07_05275 [Alteromonas sediminis]
MLKFLSAKSHKVTTNFSFIGWDDLVKVVENPPYLGAIDTKQAKAKSAIIAATDAPDKQKSTILEHNNFTLLRLDLDETPFDMEGVTDTLENMGISSFVVHTTASHKQRGNGNRFRVYIEIAESLTYKTWATLEAYLCYVFRADDCASRPQQIMYLPVTYDGSHYEYHVSKGMPLKTNCSILMKRAIEFCKKQHIEQEKAIAGLSSHAIKPTIKESLVGKQVSIIDLFNSNYGWDELLTSFGYVKQNKAWLPPESTSKTAGAYILQSPTDGRERYYSHHESDPCATGKAIDQFDFITIREYGGDTKQALKEVALRHFPDVDRFNKKEWAINNHNQKAQLLFSGGAK